MRHKLLLPALIAAAFCSSVYGKDGSTLYPGNREPLAHKPLIELPLGSVRAGGWLEDQLRRMADGLTGHMDEIYPHVMGGRNGWLGGDGDMWERGPYWIDGLVPLAYTLDDEVLKAKVKPWVEWALASQTEDGYFGPAVDLGYEPGLQRSNAKDWWPRMVVLKFLKQYYDATGDGRVLTFFTNYFRYQYGHLKETPLDNWTYWGQERGGDNLYVVYWLYNLTGDSFLLELGDIIASQTADWKGRLSDRTTLTSLFSLHCVNLAQGLKEPVIHYQRTKEESNLKAVDVGLADIRRTIGWPTGLYGGDELLHTGNPTQGSELCTAVEMMFSLEKMIEITGRTNWADLLERVTFNALPTQVTDAYDARQYYQQLNQIEISKNGGRNFVTSYNGTDQLFGVLCGYPCCTANMHQGWPKFTKHLWFATDDNGLAAMVYAPCQVTAKVAGGQEVTLREETNYPFDETIRITVSTKRKVSFPVRLRIPGWCGNPVLTVNGAPCKAGGKGETTTIDRQWKDGDIIELTLPMRVSVSRWYERSAVIERGPLVYALRIGEKWRKVSFEGEFNGQHGDWYYEVLPTTPWNYCLQSKDINDAENAFRVVRRDVYGYPWNPENAPLEIHVKGKRVPFWHEYNGSAGPLPFSTLYQGTFSDEEEIVLIPYGCTTLRITEFPVTER